MSEYAYDIVLSAPLGQRRGTMEVSVSGKKIKGFSTSWETGTLFRESLRKTGTAGFRGGWLRSYAPSNILPTDISTGTRSI